MGWPSLPKRSQKTTGKRLELVVGGEADRLGALGEEVLGLARHGQAGDVALDVGAEDRDAGVREPFRHDLQRHRLAGAGRTGDQPVAIGEGELDVFRLGPLGLQVRAKIDLALFKNRHAIVSAARPLPA